MLLTWETERISTDRGSFEVFSAGTGQPVCVTHYYSAFTQKGNYFADLFTGIARVILVNLKECGNSDRITDESELSMLESVNDLEAIRSALGYDKWSFAGHSTGGMLGLVYAIHYAEHLDKLIAAGAAASNEYMHCKESIYCREHPRNARLREIFSLLKNAEASNEQKAQAAREWTEMSLHHPERWDYYFAKPSSGMTVQKRLDYYNRQLSFYDLRDRLHLITTPMLVMCGKYDAQCPPVFSEEICDLTVGAKLHIFKDSNHCPHLEEPDEFIEVIRGFYYSKMEENEMVPIGCSEIHYIIL